MSEHKISWGKILVGAGIAAGAVAVIAFAPQFSATVGGGIKAAVTAIFGSLGSVGEWLATKTAELAGFIQSNPGVAIGTAAGAGALAASVTPTHSHRDAERALEEESFAMREDMRRMQALMTARMAATGYQPAMAMAGQRRG